MCVTAVHLGSIGDERDVTSALVVVREATSNYYTKKITWNVIRWLVLGGKY
jgi:hypothetical protein